MVFIVKKLPHYLLLFTFLKIIKFIWAKRELMRFWDEKDKFILERRKKRNLVDYGDKGWIVCNYHWQLRALIWSGLWVGLTYLGSLGEEEGSGSIIRGCERIWHPESQVFLLVSVSHCNILTLFCLSRSHCFIFDYVRLAAWKMDFFF